MVWDLFYYKDGQTLLSWLIYIIMIKSIIVELKLPIKCQSFPHIETSLLICTTNQLTGFYMKAILVFNGLNVLETFTGLSKVEKR